MGQIIANRYRIELELGAGGMGTVFRGEDQNDHKLVAIKQLKPQLTNPELIERFLREGAALRELKHPNIVQLLGMIEEDGQHYLIMEYVAGGDLSHFIKSKSLSIAQVLQIGIDLCDALTRAHKLDIVHRDLKPANILIADDGTVRLTDFGVAHFGNKSGMTTDNSIMGTIDYLAPETFSSPADKRADIWAVGIILYEMLIGQNPFSGKNLNETLNAIVMGEVPDIEELRSDIPVALADLIYRILIKNPDERIPSIRLVGAELEAILHDKSFTPSKTKPKLALSNIFIETPIPDVANKHNLPRQATVFVGRENELASLSKLLSEANVSLVTIIAQGGMGKTRLSIEAARKLLVDYPHGVFFVELAPLADAESIPNAIAEAVGFPFAGDGRSPAQQIVDYFREKKILLVLDNFEHVLEGRELVQNILNAAPNTKILASSRERLNLSAEQVFQLEGMDFPQWESPKDALNYAAMRLFLESARRVRADFELMDEDLAHASRICRLVNGLPLAIILAASWLDTLSLKEIADEIAASIDFLESNLHDLPERQRSLRAVFDYSWQLLKPEEQAAFVRLAVFRGGMSREAGQTISGINLRSLQTFVNKSLLRRDSASGRYEIHEMLRQYAEEMLIQEGLYEESREKQAQYYTHFLAQRENDIKGRRQILAMKEIDDDFENIKVAWRYACETQDEALISKMLEPLFWYCSFRHRTMDGTELFDMARTVWQADSNSLLFGRLVMRFPADRANPETAFEQGLAIAENHQDKREIAFAKRQLGHWHSHSLWNQDIGIPLLKESIQEFEALHDDFHAAIVYDDIGWSYNISGKNAAQIAAVEKSIELRRKLGDKIGLANALRNLGGAHGGFGSGKLEPLQDWEESLKLSYEIGDKRNITWNNFMVGAYWEFEGEFEKSHPYRESAIESAKEIQEDVVIALCLLAEGIEKVLIDNDIAGAKVALEKANPNRKGRDMRVLLSYALASMIATIENNVDELKAQNSIMYEIGIDAEHPFMIWSVFVAAMVANAKGQRELAAEYLGVLMQARFVHGKVMKQWEWFGNCIQALEEKLGNEVFQAAYERGLNANAAQVVREIEANWKSL